MPLQKASGGASQATSAARVDATAEVAWAAAAEALRVRFPLQAEAIRRVEHATVTDFSPPRSTDDTMAYSVSDGPSAIPRVRVPFAGRPSDVLAVAHEFGHALQFSVTRQTFVAPILREAAAFLSTLTFLKHVREVSPEHHAEFAAAEASEAARHLGQDRATLLNKWGQRTATYDYRDNYAPAYLGAQAMTERDAAIAWEVFLGRIPVVFVAARMALGGSPNLSQDTPRVDPQYAVIGEHLYSALVRNDPLCKGTIGEAWQEVSARHPETGNAIETEGVSFLSALGMVHDLLAASPYHRTQPFGTYFRIEILPPLHHGQLRLHTNTDGRATAMATWAELSKTAAKQILASGRALNGNEWKSGATLFFNHFVARDGQLRALMRELRRDFFPDRVATSLRRNADASVRRRNRWVGLERMDATRRARALAET